MSSATSIEPHEPLDSHQPHRLSDDQWEIWPGLGTIDETGIGKHQPFPSSIHRAGLCSQDVADPVCFASVCRGEEEAICGRKRCHESDVGATTVAADVVQLDEWRPSPRDGTEHPVGEPSVELCEPSRKDHHVRLGPTPDGISHPQEAHICRAV